MSAADNPVLLLLDRRGRIQHCSDRQLLDAIGPRGTPLGWLIPDLPLRENTPAYNVAYASCTFANDRWRRFALAVAGAPATAVEVCLKVVAVGRDYGLLALLRRASACVTNMGRR